MRNDSNRFTFTHRLYFKNIDIILKAFSHSDSINPYFIMPSSLGGNNWELYLPTCSPELWQQEVNYYMPQHNNQPIPDSYKYISITIHEAPFKDQPSYIEWKSHNCNNAPAHYISSFFPDKIMEVRVYKSTPMDENRQYIAQNFNIQNNQIVNRYGTPIKKYLKNVKDITILTDKGTDGNTTYTYKIGVYLGTSKNGKKCKSYLYLPIQCIQCMSEKPVLSSQLNEIIQSHSNLYVFNVALTDDSYMVYNLPPNGGKGQMTTTDIAEKYQAERTLYIQQMESLRHENDRER